MLKVMTIVGTRPDIIKMSRVIAEFDQHTRHVLVHTGQNFDYELNQIFFEDMGIRKPDYLRVVTKANAGLIFPADNATALADVVLKLFQMKPEERVRLGENGRAHLEAHYRLETCMAELVTHIEEVVARHKS